LSIGVIGVLIISFFLWGQDAFLNVKAFLANDPPYPPSSVIKDVIWDLTSLRREAPGSDLWPTTWADDNHLYTSWGDGGGFGGTNKKGRVSLGVARIEGHPETFRGFNIFGGYNPKIKASFVGKPTGLICIDGVLYMGIVEQDLWLRWKIGRSSDYGKNWEFNGQPFNDYWDFAESDGAFSDTTFLNFGINYQDVKDEYIYAYSQDNRANHSSDWKTHAISMFRMPKDNLMNIKASEFYAGLDSSGHPLWTSNIFARKPVFYDPKGVGWGVRVVYNPGIKRYLLTTWHSYDGSWGIFDAPEPWGPWTTVAYYEKWLDSIPKFGFDFPQKWMSRDGLTLWMVFSGRKKYDSFNVVQGKITLN
jgi:hypothetical protein